MNQTEPVPEIHIAAQFRRAQATVTGRSLARRYLRNQQDHYFRVIRVSAVSIPAIMVLQPLYDPQAGRLVISGLSLSEKFTIISCAARYAHRTEP